LNTFLSLAALVAATTMAPGSNALWVISSANMAEACGNAYGRVGYASLKPCQPPGPQFVGIPRLVLQAVYEAAHDKPGCDPSARELLA